MTAYTKTGNPPSNMRGVSDLIRAEFVLIEAAVNSKGDGNFAGTEAQGATVNDYVITMTPAITAYATGSIVAAMATHTNTGAATLKINALTAKTFKNVDGNDLESGDIVSGSAFAAYYNGADFFLLSGNDRIARSGDTYTGTHDYTNATISSPQLDAKAPLASPALTGIPTAPTASVGTAGTQIATVDFVAATAFSPILPGQVGSDGKFLTTDGSNASWAAVPVLHLYNIDKGIS